jgi:hypothetical protein
MEIPLPAFDILLKVQISLIDFGLTSNLFDWYLLYPVIPVHTGIFSRTEKKKKLNELPLVEKGLSIPVPEGLLCLLSNRYTSFGTKVPPIVSLV